MKTQESYRHALETAREELARLLAQQKGLTERIKWLQVTISSLQLVVGENPGDGMLNLVLDPDAGITDAVRYFLKHNPNKSFAPVEILDGLRSIGFNMPRYSNEFAVISNVLQRLKAGGEVRSSRTPQGHKMVYRWKGVKPRVSDPVDNDLRPSMEEERQR